MGSAASFHEQPEEVQKEIYRKIAQLYDNEYIPKLQNQELQHGEGFAMFRKRFEQLMSEIPISENNENNKITSNRADSKEDSSSSAADQKQQQGGGGTGAGEGGSVAHTLSSFYTTFMIGDIIKVRHGFMMYEGVVIDIQATTLDVDYGDDIENVLIENCCLVMNGLDYEVGDYVSACPAGELYFNGKITSINTNGTFDILFDGDEPENVERNIRPDKLRKIRTGRQLVLNRWQKAKNLISMSLAWGASIHQEDRDRDRDGEREDKGEGEGDGEGEENQEGKERDRERDRDREDDYRSESKYESCREGKDDDEKRTKK